MRHEAICIYVYLRRDESSENTSMQNFQIFQARTTASHVQASTVAFCFPIKGSLICAQEYRIYARSTHWKTLQVGYAALISGNRGKQVHHEPPHLQFSTRNAKFRIIGVFLIFYNTLRLKFGVPVHCIAASTARTVPASPPRSSYLFNAAIAALYAGRILRILLR